MSTFCFLFIIELSKSSEKRDTECIVDVLKRQNVSDESFDSVGLFFGDNKKCERYIRNSLNDIFDETKEKLRNDVEHRKINRCVLNDLRNDDHYQQSALLAKVVHFSECSWKFWKYFERRKRTINIKAEVATIEFETIKLCTEKYDKILISDDEDIDGCGSGEVPDVFTRKNVEDKSFYFDSKFEE